MRQEREREIKADEMRERREDTRQDREVKTEMRER